MRHVLFPSFPERANKRFSLARKAVDLLATRGFEVELHTLHYVPHDDVPVWLNASDCLLLTSTQEGSPNIVKEALACDRPVVSVDVGDVAERTAGRQDCFVTAHRPEDLAAKLEIVLRNRAAFSGVRTLPGVSDLSLEAVAERLCQVYRIVIDRWVASHRRAAA